MTLFLVYYGAQYGFSTLANLLVGQSVEINPFLAGMVALGLVLSSYSERDVPLRLPRHPARPV